GPISLSFDIDRLRSAGLLPVIYAPQGVAAGLISQMSTFAVRAAWHTKHVLARLQELKDCADPALAIARFGHPLNPDATFQFQNIDPKGSVVARYEVPISNIDSLMKFIGYRNIPFDH